MSSLAAQATESTGAGSGIGSLLLLALPLLLIVYLVTSQRKRQKEMTRMQASLGVGDEVMTTTGLFGRIVGLDERLVHLEISDGVVVRHDRRGIVQVPGTAGVDRPTGQDGEASGRSGPDAE